MFSFQFPSLFQMSSRDTAVRRLRDITTKFRPVPVLRHFFARVVVRSRLESWVGGPEGKSPSKTHHHRLAVRSSSSQGLSWARTEIASPGRGRRPTFRPHLNYICMCEPFAWPVLTGYGARVCRRGGQLFQKCNSSRKCEESFI